MLAKRVGMRFESDWKSCAGGRSGVRSNQPRNLAAFEEQNVVIERFAYLSHTDPRSQASVSPIALLAEIKESRVFEFIITITTPEQGRGVLCFIKATSLVLG
jgi:hypothetical protein